jgi:hypothetical protein
MSVVMLDALVLLAVAYAGAVGDLRKRYWIL